MKKPVCHFWGSHENINRCVFVRLKFQDNFPCALQMWCMRVGEGLSCCIVIVLKVLWTLSGLILVTWLSTYETLCPSGKKLFCFGMMLLVLQVSRGLFHELIYEWAMGPPKFMCGQSRDSDWEVGRIGVVGLVATHSITLCAKICLQLEFVSYVFFFFAIKCF